MLQRVLKEIKSARGPVSLNELSNKLGIQPSALNGMIEDLVKKGYLQENNQALEGTLKPFIGGSCCNSCPGSHRCPSIMKMPRTLSITSPDNRKVKKP